MFDANLCAAADLRQMGDLCRQLVECRLALLRQLGHSRDIELLFVAGDYCRPDWSLVDYLDEEAQRIIRQIFDNAHDVARAEDELELRASPN
jgi:signal transduction histidine kinase